MDTIHQAQDSSSSDLTVISMRSDAILALGKKIVDDLGLDETADTLGRWMAHYIAELIHGAETAKAKERPAKMAKCADAILDLWKHRHQLPAGKRPFEDFDPILRALASLDPSDDTPRYYRPIRNAVEETDENPETRKWLELSDDIDYAAKSLICYCLMKASHTALDRSKEWVKLAEAAKADEDIDIAAIRSIDDKSNLFKFADPDERARKRLEDRIKQLDGFKKKAAALTSELRQQLKQSDTSEKNS